MDPEALARELMEAASAGGSVDDRLASHPSTTSSANWEQLALVCRSLGKEYDDLALARVCVSLRRLLPSGSLAWHLTEAPIRACVPAWHWPMLHDQVRNDAYAAAIMECVSADKIVLEIGSGSGLLALIAAQAGARHVYSCEANPMIADCAQKNIDAAGFSDKITIINKKAEDLVLGQDVQSKCDVVIHELLSGDLLSEGVLEIINGLDKEILHENAEHLPNRIFSKIQSVASLKPLEKHFCPVFGDFSVSQIDILAPSHSRHAASRDFAPIGSPFTLEEYQVINNQFQRTGAEPPRLREFMLPHATGILQWIGFSFPDGTQYENSPLEDSHWKRRFFPFSDDLNAREDLYVLSGSTGKEQVIYFGPQG